MIINTQLLASCGDWSPNGHYFAVGGVPAHRTSAEKKSSDFDQVNIYSPYGNVSYDSKHREEYVSCNAKSQRFSVSASHTDSWNTMHVIGMGCHVIEASFGSWVQHLLC